MKQLLPLDVRQRLDEQLANTEWSLVFYYDQSALCSRQYRVICAIEDMAEFDDVTVMYVKPPVDPDVMLASTSPVITINEGLLVRERFKGQVGLDQIACALRRLRQMPSSMTA